MKTTFNNCFKIYLFLLLLFIIYYLYQKHLNLVEWTVSEWLINYQGGFTRRGLIGEMIYQSSLLLIQSGQSHVSSMMPYVTTSGLF